MSILKRVWCWLVVRFLDNPTPLQGVVREERRKDDTLGKIGLLVVMGLLCMSLILILFFR